MDYPTISFGHVFTSSRILSNCHWKNKFIVLFKVTIKSLWVGATMHKGHLHLHFVKMGDELFEDCGRFDGEIWHIEIRIKNYSVWIQWNKFTALHFTSAEGIRHFCKIIFLQSMALFTLSVKTHAFSQLLSCGCFFRVL